MQLKEGAASKLRAVEALKRRKKCKVIHRRKYITSLPPHSRCFFTEPQFYDSAMPNVCLPSSTNTRLSSRCFMATQRFVATGYRMHHKRDWVSVVRNNPLNRTLSLLLLAFHSVSSLETMMKPKETTMFKLSFTGRRKCEVMPRRKYITSPPSPSLCFFPHTINRRNARKYLFPRPQVFLFSCLPDLRSAVYLGLIARVSREVSTASKSQVDYGDSENC